MNAERPFLNPLVALIRRSMFWRPNFHQGDSWLEFIPVGFWLVDAIRPKRILEIGVESGNFYFALCQSAHALNLDCQSVALVNEVASDDEVSSLAHLQRHNSYNYAGFSKVMTAESLNIAHVEDNSLDLVVINSTGGVSLSEFFASVLRKLTSGGVVVARFDLFRSESSGLEFLDFIRANFKCFELTHGAGLFIIQCGTKPVPTMTRLLECAESSLHRQTVREVFSSLGQACADAYAISSSSLSGLSALSLRPDGRKTVDVSPEEQIEPISPHLDGACSEYSYDTSSERHVGDGDKEVVDLLRQFLELYDVTDSDITPNLGGPLELLARSENATLKKLAEIFLKAESISANLRLQMDEAIEASALLNEQIAERNGQVDHLRNALSFRDKELLQVKTALIKAQSDVSRLDASIQERFEEIAKITGIAETQRQESVDAQKNAESQRKKFIEAQKTTDSLQKKLIDAQKIAENQQQKLADAQKNLEALTTTLEKSRLMSSKKLKAQEAAFQEVSSRIIQLESDLAQAEAEKSVVQKINEATALNLKKLLQEKDMLSQQNEDLAAEFDKHKGSSSAFALSQDEVIARYQVEKKVLETSILDLNVKVKEYQRNTKFLKAELDTLAIVSKKFGEQADLIRGQEEQIRTLTGLLYDNTKKIKSKDNPPSNATAQSRKIKLPYFNFKKSSKAKSSDSNSASPMEQIELIKKSGLFDTTWYADVYDDVRKAGIDPIVHYVRHGAAEGRNPSPGFNTLEYQNAHPSLQDQGINAFFHAIQTGKVK